MLDTVLTQRALSCANHLHGRANHLQRGPITGFVYLAGGRLCVPGCVYPRACTWLGARVAAQHGARPVEPNTARMAARIGPAHLAARALHAPRHL